MTAPANPAPAPASATTDLAAAPAADRASVVAAVLAALVEVLDRPLPEATEATRLFDDLGIDSTSVLGLLMNLEDTLDIEIDTDSLEQHHLETVGTLADFTLENL